MKRYLNKKIGGDKMKKKMKKFGALLLVIITVFSITGCGGSSGDGKSASDSGGKDSSDIPTATILMYTDWYKEGWKDLEEHINANAEEVGFKLEIQTVAGGDQGDQLIKVKFASDDLPDLVQTYGPKWIDAAASSLDKVVDLTDIIDTSDYDQDLLDTFCIMDGKLLAMPVDTSSLTGVLYNKAVFENLNLEIPTDWASFLTVCEAIKQAGITPVYCTYKDTWTSQLFPLNGMSMDIAEKGGDFAAFLEGLDTNQIQYKDCTNFIEAIGRSKELIESGYINETYLSDSYDNGQEALINGDAAMIINATWTAETMAGKFPDQIDNIGGFALPTPNGENYICKTIPFAVSIPTCAPDQELSVKVLQYVSSTEAQQIYASAQPGIYANTKVECDLLVAQQELKAAAETGNSMTDFEELVAYKYGSLAEYLLNYYTGTYSSPEDVVKAMDEEVAKNAAAKEDSNWN